jgi:hypothetical protein
MARLLCAACALLLLLTAPPQNSTFLKYKAVEAYEVRPGILMFPRYAEDGRVCEVGLERRLYSPEKVVAYSTLSRQEIDEIVNELAPGSERGPRSESSVTSLIGRGMTTLEQYENVTVQIGSALIENPGENAIVDDVTAVIT